MRINIRVKRATTALMVGCLLMPQVMLAQQAVDDTPNEFAMVGDLLVARPIGAVMTIGGAAVWLVRISHYYHVLGTDLGGADVLYQSLKGVRTGVLLGTLATLIMLLLSGLSMIGAVAGTSNSDEQLPDDPWDGFTLEWATPSPPPSTCPKKTSPSPGPSTLAKAPPISPPPSCPKPGPPSFQ